MAKRSSGTQIDRLGQRLRTQAFLEDDLTQLDEYRRTFGAGYDEVVAKLERILRRPVSGRPAKSTTSIIEKLNRESIRLSQMQDIAGCRVIVEDVREQDRAVSSITTEFSEVVVVDRRLKPSHGYRAVHLIVRAQKQSIEVQVRTALQHLWAAMSEKCADVIDPALKYGGGPAAFRELLDTATARIALIEELEDSGMAEGLLTMRSELVDHLQRIIRNLNEGGPEF